MNYDPIAIIESALTEEQAASVIEQDKREKEQGAELQTKKLNTYRASETIGKDIKAPPYVIDDLLSVGLTTMAAPPKIGKSFMALDIAYSVATGGKFFDSKSSQGDVLYLDLEGAQWSVVDRLDKIKGHRPERLHFAHEALGIDEGLIDQLRDWCDREGVDPKLIIIDTLGSVPGKRRRGEDAYQYSTRINQELQRFAINRGLAVIVITHKTKSKGFKPNDVLEEVTGGMGGVGKSDSVWLIHKKRDEDTGVLTVISKGREYRDLAVRFDKCVWTLVAKDNTAYMEELEYTRNLTVITIKDLVKKLTKEGLDAWEGTATQLRALTVEYLGEIPSEYNARAAGSDVRKYQARLLTDGIEVKSIKRRAPGTNTVKPFITVRVAGTKPLTLYNNPSTTPTTPTTN